MVAADPARAVGHHASLPPIGYSHPALYYPRGRIFFQKSEKDDLTILPVGLPADHFSAVNHLERNRPRTKGGEHKNTRSDTSDDAARSYTVALE